MTRRSLIVGIVGGLAAAMGLAILLSVIAIQSNAQMMMPQQHQGTNGMLISQWYAMPTQQHSVFSANGISMIQDVRISGIAVTGDNEISVNLAYNGSGNSPDVTVIAMTNHMAMIGGSSSSMGGMGDMMKSHGIGSMADQSMMEPSMPAMWNDAGMSSWNATQWRNWHSHVTIQSGWTSPDYSVRSQAGSSVLSSGWQSGSTVKVKLNGDASAYNSSDLHVMVFPHLS